MIKGRYVCQIIADINIDEKAVAPSALEELRELAKNGQMEDQIKELLEDEYTKVTVEQQYADFYRVRD